MKKERLRKIRCAKNIWEFLCCVLIFKIHKLFKKIYYNFNLLKVITKLIIKWVFTYLLKSQSRHENQRIIYWLLYLKIITVLGDGELTVTWIGWLDLHIFSTPNISTLNYWTRDPLSHGISSCASCTLNFRKALSLEESNADIHATDPYLWPRAVQLWSWLQLLWFWSLQVLWLAVALWWKDLWSWSSVWGLWWPFVWLGSAPELSDALCWLCPLWEYWHCHGGWMCDMYGSSSSST